MLFNFLLPSSLAPAPYVHAGRAVPDPRRLCKSRAAVCESYRPAEGNCGARGLHCRAGDAQLGRLLPRAKVRSFNYSCEELLQMAVFS